MSMILPFDTTFSILSPVGSFNPLRNIKTPQARFFPDKFLTSRDGSVHNFTGPLLGFLMTGNYLLTAQR